MKKSFLIIILFLQVFSFRILGQENDRFSQIRSQLEQLAQTNKKLTKSYNSNAGINGISLSKLLLAVSSAYDLSVSIDPSLEDYTVLNSFSDISAIDLFVFLCQNHPLDIQVTGSIIQFSKYEEPEKPIDQLIKINYDRANDLLSLDVENQPMELVARQLINKTGINVLFAKEIKNQPIGLFIQDAFPGDVFKQLALLNDMSLTKSREGFYLFYKKTPNQGGFNRNYAGSGATNYTVLDSINKVLAVDFVDVPIEDIIYQLSQDLNLSVYFSSNPEQLGTTTIKSESILFDDLLSTIFEGTARIQETSTTVNTADLNSFEEKKNFTFRKVDDMYFFGTSDQLSVRESQIIPLKHRSIELLEEPEGRTDSFRSAGRTINANQNFINGTNPSFVNQPNIARPNIQDAQFSSFDNPAESLLSIIPEEVKADLEINVDFELNSFLVTGSPVNIARFSRFVQKIDNPVPVVLIEVMLIEVRKSTIVETGINWGLGSEPTQTSGSVFPTTDLTLGANTVNRIIGGFDGFGSLNIGRVVPEFFAQIKAMEENGNLKIRSAPRLSTLNGHRATLSIGETDYYVVTSQNFFGSQIPTTSEVRNYLPVDAELALSIKPLVSADGNVTLDIHVVQSNFSGERIEEDAPPGITSREFSSIVRMKNQDLAVLGGLEENLNNDSGSGVPFLARVPIIKYLFSKRRREASKQKLTILIKPTIIY